MIDLDTPTIIRVALENSDSFGEFAKQMKRYGMSRSESLDWWNDKHPREDWPEMHGAYQNSEGEWEV